MKITLTNDFHRTEHTIIVRNGVVSHRAASNSQRKLCGVDGCICGGPMGQRGTQVDADGNALIIEQIDYPSRACRIEVVKHVD